MREILFRGKRTDNGEWIEGMLFNGKEDTFIIPHGNEYSYDEQEGLSFDVYGCKVDPETVGQYTGLTDKNGKKIFEGDIVHCVSSRDDTHMVVIYEEGEFRLVLCKDFKDYKCGLWFYAIRDYAKEVIGNIHDSPELLKGVNE